MPLRTQAPFSIEIQASQYAGAQGGARPGKAADRFESCTRAISLRKHETINSFSIECYSRIRIYWIRRGEHLCRPHRLFKNLRIKGVRPNPLAGYHDFTCHRDNRLSGYQEKREEILMNAHKYLKSRKDARLVFRKNQIVSVRCFTDRCNFDARIQDVSSSGIFIKTDQELPVGEEIALSFTFPDSGNQVMATGKIVRTTDSGMGIEIQVYFKEKPEELETRRATRKNSPTVVFLGSSNSTK